MSLANPSHWTTMVLPIVVIAALAVFIPLGLAKRLPHSWAGLGTNLLVSGMVLLALSTAYFAAFRPPKSLILITEAGEYYSYGAKDLLMVGLQSMMIWLPILLLVLAMQPQKWRPEL